MARKAKQIFVFPKLPFTSKYIIKIDGTDYTDEIVSLGGVEFTKVLCPEVGTFKFELLNASGSYSELFNGGETVDLYLDFSDGSTKRFEGKLEKVENVYKDGYYVIKCQGSHVSGELLDKNVTEKYSGDVLVHNIIIDLFSSYFPQYTTTNVGTSFTNYPIINWQDKPFWDAINDLCNVADADCYIDDDRDVHFFKSESIENTTDVAVWDDRLIEVDGLGSDTLEVRNKVIVYGKDDDGNIIIYTASDSGSQTSHGVKEKVIRDENVKSYDGAMERGNAELDLLKATSVSGRVTSLLLPSLNPGEKLYVISPLQKIHNSYRCVSVTHKFPDEMTDVEIEKSVALPKLFKNDFLKQLATEGVDNAYKLEYTYNFSFIDYDNIDTDSSTSNIRIASGYLDISSDTSGTMLSNVRTTSNDISLVYLSVAGDNMSSVTFYVSCSEPESWQEITPNILTTISSTGKKLRLKIFINSNTSRVDYCNILYK